MFAFYEVSVGPASYTIYALESGSVADRRTLRFDHFSFAQVEPVEGNDGAVYWLTQDGDLAGYAYRFPIRATSGSAPYS